MSCRMEVLRGSKEESYGKQDEFEVFGKIRDRTVKVTRANFQELGPHLTHLRLSQLGLTCIPSILFSLPLPNLTGLDLSRNRISEVPEAILRLEQLEVLDLSHNLLRAFPLVPPKLDRLFVAHNQISSIPDLSESRITVLDAEGNCIEYSHFWRFPRGIVRAKLSKNCIETLPDMGGLDRLETLELNRNRLTQMPDLKIDKLEVSGNPINLI